MMRFFGSSAPATGAGPAGQLAVARVPARMAAAKLVASILPRPGASFGVMLSPGNDSAAPVAVAVVAESLEAGVADGVGEGEGAAATSPALAADCGASVAQAETRSVVATMAESGMRSRDMRTTMAPVSG